MRYGRLMAGVASFFAFSGLCFSGNVSALVSNGELDSNGVLISANRGLELSATIDAESLLFDITSSDLQTKTITVTAHTNNATGYSVSMNGAMGFDYLVNKGMPTAGKINSLTGTFNADNFPTTGWGYATNAESPVFSAIPMSLTSIARTSTYGTNRLPVIIGVRAGDEIPAGTYENKLVFTVVANLSLAPACNEMATTIEEAVCMQDINESIKDSMIAYQQYQLYDSRDSKLYYVMKNGNGFVWMTQNLDLDLSPEMTLTYLDTNLSEGTWTPQDSTYKSGMKVVPASERIGFSPAMSYDPGDYHMDYYEFIKYDGPDCQDVASCEYFSPGIGTHTDVGNLYTYPAAIAMSGISRSSNNGPLNESGDICPRGWEIPKDFAGSLTVIDENRDGVYNEGALPYDTEIEEFLQAPYHFVYSDVRRVDDISQSNGLAGAYIVKGVKSYSSHLSGEMFRYNLDMRYVSTVTSGFAEISDELMSIRCVAK